MSDAPAETQVSPEEVLTLRERLGEPGKPISQSELARRVGVAQSTIHRIENGDMVAHPTLTLLLRRMLEEQAAA